MYHMKEYELKFISIFIQEIFASRFTYYDVRCDVTISQYGVDKRTLHEDCRIESFELICHNVCLNDERNIT